MNEYVRDQQELVEMEREACREQLEVRTLFKSASNYSSYKCTESTQHIRTARSPAESIWEYVPLCSSSTADQQHGVSEHGRG